MTENDQSKVICNICAKIYSLGSSNPKHRTTGNIKSHLKSKHLNEYYELIELRGSTCKEKIVKPCWDEDFDELPNETISSPDYPKFEENGIVLPEIVQNDNIG